MTRLTDQITFADISEEYAAFEDKFKPKKTTDDCYTPEIVFNAIKDWVCKRYGIDEAHIVRPFWPGADYKTIDYPDGCVVLDNPPFSIISQIVQDYNKAGIKYWLFAPYLTNLGIRGCGHVITDVSITYENGALVNTSFVTNLEPGMCAMSAPELGDIIKAANNANLKTKGKPELPKYSYPSYVLSSTMLGYLAAHHVEYVVQEKDTYFIRGLDSQKATGKAIFGSGYLLSEKAAAEKAAAEKAAAEKVAAHVWKLSEREKEIIKKLSKEG